MAGYSRKDAGEQAKSLIEGVDFIIEADSGLLVLSASYLLKRGYCCGQGCRKCPYPADQQVKAGRAPTRS